MRDVVALAVIVVITGGTVDLLSSPPVVQLGYGILLALGPGVAGSLSIIGVALYWVMMYGVYAILDGTSRESVR